MWHLKYCHLKVLGCAVAFKLCNFLKMRILVLQFLYEAEICSGKAQALKFVNYNLTIHVIAGKYLSSHII